jgi:serine/threonine protein kinase
VHSKGVIHRDLKPANLLTGRKDPGTIHLIDFGLSTS